mgnify:CR=1 FL=1
MVCAAVAQAFYRCQHLGACRVLEAAGVDFQGNFCGDVMVGVNTQHFTHGRELSRLRYVCCRPAQIQTACVRNMVIHQVAG